MVALRAARGRASEFQSAFTETGREYFAQPGCRGSRFYVSEDDAESFSVVVDWDDRKAMDAAAGSPTGQRFLGAIGPLLADRPIQTFFTPVEH